MARKSATDEFGFRIGTKCAKAAAMFKRGATQAEIEAATGYTQYNTLRAAQRRGHKVSKVGEKYYLEAAEGSSGHRSAPRVIWVKVGPGGRIVIPAAYREAIGVQEGDDVQVWLEEDEIRVISRAGAIRRAEELVAKYVPPDVSLVDELIAERRREAAREEAGE